MYLHLCFTTFVFEPYFKAYLYWHPKQLYLTFLCICICISLSLYLYSKSHLCLQTYLDLCLYLYLYLYLYSKSHLCLQTYLGGCLAGGISSGEPSPGLARAPPSCRNCSPVFPWNCHLYFHELLIGIFSPQILLERSFYLFASQNIKLHLIAWLWTIAKAVFVLTCSIIVFQFVLVLAVFVFVFPRQLCCIILYCIQFVSVLAVFVFVFPRQLCCIILQQQREGLPWELVNRPPALSAPLLSTCCF